MLRPGSDVILITVKIQVSARTFLSKGRCVRAVSYKLKDYPYS